MTCVYGGLTSSDIRVAIALPISWYDLALPLGPSKMNKNLQIEQNCCYYEAIILNSE